MSRLLQISHEISAKFAIAPPKFKNIFTPINNVSSFSLTSAAKYGISYSPTSNFVSIAQGTSVIYTYIYVDDVITKLNTTNMPSVSFGVKFCCFSNSSDYLMVQGNFSPYMIIYKRNGNTFTPLTFPTLTGSTMYGSFGLNDEYLALPIATSNRPSIYKRSGDTFTKLVNTPTLSGTALPLSMNFSPDGNYVSVGLNDTPFLNIWKRTGDLFENINISEYPTNDIKNTAFSPDGTHLAAVQITTSPYLHIYKKDGDTFTKLSVPSMPSGCNACKYSRDGELLYVATAVSPYIIILKRNGDTYTKLDNPSSLPSSPIGMLDVSKEDDTVTCVLSAAPYMINYRRS